MAHAYGCPKRASAGHAQKSQKSQKGRRQGRKRREKELTYLKRDKHDTLHSVTNEEQVLQCPQGRHVDSHIDKCDPHEALVGIERPNEDLGSGMISSKPKEMGERDYAVAKRGNNSSLVATRGPDMNIPSDPLNALHSLGSRILR